MEIKPLAPENHEGPCAADNWVGLPQELVEFWGDSEMRKLVWELFKSALEEYLFFERD